MHSNARIANDTWEALFRAQAATARSLGIVTDWGKLNPREYGVLYALAAAPDGLRISDLGRDVLLTQAGISRLITRLEARGLLERATDAGDGRARRIRLTAAGIAIQREIGLIHAKRVTELMTRVLDRHELLALLEMCRRLSGAAHAADPIGCPVPIGYPDHDPSAGPDELTALDTRDPLSVD